MRLTKRQFEAGYPWAGGILTWYIAASLMPAWVYQADKARGLVDPVVNVAAIAIAFFVAVAVMLGTLKADPLIKELQRIDAFPILLTYLRSAIYVWGAVIIVGLILKIVPATAIVLGSLFVVMPKAVGRVPQFTWYGTLVPFWVATLVVGSLTGHRVVRVLFGLLRYRDPRLVRQKPPDQPDDDETLVLPAERRRRATL